MRRIKENELKNIIKEFYNRKIIIEITGPIEEKVMLKSLDNNLQIEEFKFKIASEDYKLEINFGFVEEIYYFEKEKLIIKMENELNIFIKIEN